MNTTNAPTSAAGLRWINGGLCAARGFAAAGLHAGIKAAPEEKDLMLLTSKVPCSAAAVYTQNKVQGAPLKVTKQHLENGRAQAILCNSGNANTCAPGGEDFARWCCSLAASATGLAAEDIIVASTGVIGQALPKAAFKSGVPRLASALSADGGSDAAEAIMTTDTVKKSFALEFQLGGKTCRLGGAAKGSGMVAPNMATMLCFVTTDVDIAPGPLQNALSHACRLTLNQLCVDGDTSTNDMLAALAGGQAGNDEITGPGHDYDIFFSALCALLRRLALALAADGEGATKRVVCQVSGAKTNEVARAVARSVVGSSLFKAAMFGQDANWGRALCAIGYTPGNFSTDDISLSLKSGRGEVLVCRHSVHHPFSEAAAADVLADAEIEVCIDMHEGTGTGEAFGCDLTYDYVKINGDYRS